ncbi:MAG: hypothetical protein AB3N24_14555, partial [Leisingera sp.]
MTSAVKPEGRSKKNSPGCCHPGLFVFMDGAGERAAAAPALPPLHRQSRTYSAFISVMMLMVIGPVEKPPT